MSVRRNEKAWDKMQDRKHLQRRVAGYKAAHPTLLVSKQVPLSISPSGWARLILSEQFWFTQAYYVHMPVCLKLTKHKKLKVLHQFCNFAFQTWLMMIFFCKRDQMWERTILHASLHCYWNASDKHHFKSSFIYMHCIALGIILIEDLENGDKTDN